MIRAIVGEVRKRGWRAEVVFCSAAKERTWLTELALDEIPYRFAPDVPVIALRHWLVKSVLSDYSPTVLHTHFTGFDVAAALASRGRSDVVVFWHIHSRAPLELSVRIRNFVKYAFIGRLVERIFCVAPDIAQIVRRRGGSTNRVVYVPNAINTSRFSATGLDDKFRARRQLGLPLEARILLHFGWDWQRKGGDTFVQTVGTLTRASGMAVMGVTVGGGERARLAVAAQGLNDYIRVLEPTNDVQALYAAADVFLAPSLAEGMPFAITEALCTGLAVVGSNIPGHAVIAQNIDACRLTALDPEALAAAVLVTLSRDAGAMAAEGRAARAEVIRRFDLAPWAERMVDNYTTEQLARLAGT